VPAPIARGVDFAGNRLSEPGSSRCFLVNRLLPGVIRMHCFRSALMRSHKRALLAFLLTLLGAEPGRVHSGPGTPTKSVVGVSILNGDAVLTNGRVTVVMRQGDCAADVYGTRKGEEPSPLRLQLLALDGAPAAHLQRVAAIESTRSAAAVEVVYATAKGDELVARLRLKKGEVSVQVQPGPGAGLLRMACPAEFAVLPDFFADDIVIEAKHMPAGRVELPGEDFLLHLTGHGDIVAACVFEKRTRDVAVRLAGAAEQRHLESSEIPFEGKNVWVAILQGHGMWHTRQIATQDTGTDMPLDWKMPFPAQWRADFTRNNGLTDSWEMLLPRPDGTFLKPSIVSAAARQALAGTNGRPFSFVRPSSDACAEVLNSDRIRWNTNLGTYAYPCWFDHDRRGHLQPLALKSFNFCGPCVMYPLNRVLQTPLEVYTVVDVMRSTLGVGPCQRVLDLEGQKDEYRGKATCTVQMELLEIFQHNRQRREKAEVERILDDGLVFVTHIRSRIDHYIEFGRQMRHYLAEQKTAHPEITTFLDEMDEITRAIDARVAFRADYVRSPAAVAEMNENFRKQVVDTAGASEYASALVLIGYNQDELCAECRNVVKNLRQRAALRMALDPRLAAVVNEIRSRTQQALRNPACHEGARH
jgi:hypothetical protein